MTLINKSGRIRVLKYICSEGRRFMSNYSLYRLHKQTHNLNHKLVDIKLPYEPHQSMKGKKNIPRILLDNRILLDHK